MSGSDYVALVRLSNKANETLAFPGEDCHRVPESSLESLERDGKIKRREQEPAPAAPVNPYRRRPARHSGESE